MLTRCRWGVGKQLKHSPIWAVNAIFVIFSLPVVYPDNLNSDISPLNVPQT